MRKLITISAIIIIGLVAWVIVTRMPGKIAKAVKKLFPANAPEKFLEYLQRTLSPNQLNAFQDELIELERMDSNEKFSYEQTVADRSSKTKIPEAVINYLDVIASLKEKGILDSSLFKKIDRESFFMYNDNIKILN